MTKEKEYEKTHPWINYKIDFEKASIYTLMLLGSAQSKCNHIANALLAPEISRELYSVYMAKGAAATTAIEGNTLSEGDVLKIISKSLELPKSKKYLGIEVKNILTAFDAIANEHIKNEGAALCVEEIKKYNLMCLQDLELGEDVVPGELRTHSVLVGRYRGVQAQYSEELLNKLCKMLTDDTFSLGEGWKIATGILKAIIAHLYIAWIHPFADGNGRTARLVEFKMCISSGIPVPAAHLLSNHYNETREAYYRALDETSKKQTPFPFVNYALQGYVDQLDNQIEVIRESQYKSFWENYIHRSFHGKDTPAAVRRRHLALDVSRASYDDMEGPGVAISEIPNLTARLARHYATVKPKTIESDVQELVKMDLIARAKGRIRPKIEKLLFFLPPTVRKEDTE